MRVLSSIDKPVKNCGASAAALSAIMRVRQVQQTGAPVPIGTLSEQALHAALKTWLQQPGDLLEAPLPGTRYHIDILRGDLLIEIQTRQFAAIKPKLTRLVEAHPLRLVHPISVDRRLVTLNADGTHVLSLRKSPRRGSIYHLFSELLRFPSLMQHPNFTLEVLLIRDEEIRRADGLGSWRRKGLSIVDRRLIEVVERRVFESPADLCALLPASLPETFTTKALAGAIRQPDAIAQRTVYCLRHMDALELVGKRGNAHLYRRRDAGTGAQP